MPGPAPIRIPYGRQWISEEDIAAVTDALRSAWLTTGPRVGDFEKSFASAVGAREAVAVTNGTAALHAALHAAGIGPGDEVIVPSMTFAATANAVVYQGGIPRFADVYPDSLLIDPASIEAMITPRTKAVIAVDYAGHPAGYDKLRQLAGRRGLVLVDDAAHSLGARYKGRPVGTLADLTTFSFHPVKIITTGEGGMVATDDPERARRMRVFRNHGITADHHQRSALDSWFYEMTDLGFNYRLTDFQCALGLSQLRKVPVWADRRREIACRYDAALRTLQESGIAPLAVSPDVSHAYHLYVIRVDGRRIAGGRAALFAELRKAGIGVNVHYIPVHLHPFYRERFGTGPGLCPVAEKAYAEILTLPVYPMMDDADVGHVIDILRRAVSDLAA